MINWAQYFFPPLTNRDESLFKAAWMIRIRWVVILLQIIALVFLGFTNSIVTELYPYFVGIINLSLVFTAISILLIKGRTSTSEAFLVFQVIFDLLQMFIFLFLVSFKINPLVEIFYLNLIIAIFSLPLIWNSLHLVFLLFILWFFNQDHATDFHQHHHLYSHFFTMVIIWAIFNWLMSIVRSYQKKFSKIQDYKNRMDRLQSIGAMSSGICHELATPLNTIKLKTNRIARKNEYSPDDLQIIIGQVEKCETAIKKLADSARNLDGPIEELLDLCAINELVLKNFNVDQFELDCSDRVSIVANKAILIQTLYDLINNAIEASGNDKIKITIYQNEERVVWEIINSGAVFPHIVLDKLGEPFLTGKVNGTGLGLFNAYNFMLASNGLIKIQNTSDHKAMVQLLFEKI